MDKPNIDIAKWEQDIPDILNNVFNNKDEPHPFRGISSEATELIKELIGNYGLQQNLDVCANGYSNANCDREWLWDMIWYEMDNTGRTISVPLVVESEMSPAWHDIYYDFEKLMAANADLRVMICCSTKNGNEEIIMAEIESYVKHFAESIQGYRQLPVKARFLILIWEHNWWGGFFAYLLQKGENECTITPAILNSTT